MPEQSLDVAASAAVLAQARRSSVAIRSLPGHLTPRTLTDAYRVQDAFRAQWGDKLVGWKVGATAKPVQERFGVTAPFSGPLFAGDVCQSPARLPAARFIHRLIESEFAFRFAEAMTPRSGNVTRSDIVAAVDAVIPAFEIVSPRTQDIPYAQAALGIADCGLNAAIVLGKPYAAWQSLDLAAHPVVLSVDGVVKARGSGAHVLGHPLAVLDWLANHLSERGVTIEPGAIVLTGTTTGVVALASGETAVADFGSLGTIAFGFTGTS